jgi:hypothetical protein
VPSPDFTIADVLAWARTKPADETYCFLEPENCAVAQFGQATNRPELVRVGDLRKLPVPFAHDLWNAVISKGWTFAALVKRLEALCSDTPVTKSDWLSIDAYLTDQVPA